MKKSRHPARSHTPHPVPIPNENNLRYAQLFGPSKTVRRSKINQGIELHLEPIRNSARNDTRAEYFGTVYQENDLSTILHTDDEFEEREGWLDIEDDDFSDDE